MSSLTHTTEINVAQTPPMIMAARSPEAASASRAKVPGVPF